MSMAQSAVHAVQMYLLDDISNQKIMKYGTTTSDLNRRNVLHMYSIM